MLTIANGYPTGVWVAIMFYSPGCADGGDWTKEGWWRMNPGESKIVFGGDLKDLNRYYCYYAQADDGAHWSGPYVRFLPYQAFEWCEWIACEHSDGSPCGFDAGFRLLDIGGNDDYTLTLVP